MVRQLSARATVLLLLLPDLPTRLDLHWPLRLLREMATPEAPSDPDSLAPLVPANLETLPAIRRPREANLMAMLQANLLATAMRLLPEMGRPAEVNQPLPEVRRLPDRTEQHLVQVRPLAVWAKLQDLRRRPVERFPVPPAHEHRCSPDPGPCAFC